MMMTACVRARSISLVASLLLVQHANAAEARQQATAIVGATVIDGTGAPASTGATVLIAGERIEAVGPASSVRVPDGTRIIDGAGKYVLPGFVDTNVHLSLYGAGETFVRYEHQNEALTLEAAQLHLKHGVTTVRDSYGSLLPLISVRDRIARGEVPGPRILAAGNIVGWGGPYSVTFSLVRERDLTLFQEQINDFITQGSGEELMDMTPDELRVAINAYLDKGPDFIKYGGTGHFSYPSMIGFSPDAQRVLVEEAHRRGKVAETHSTSPEGLRLSVLAGIDLIQHPEVLPGEMPDELLQLIVERDVICAILANTITGTVWERHLKAKEEREKAAADSTSDENRDSGAERAKTSAEIRAERRERDIGLEIRRQNAQRLIGAGCRVTIATDNYLGSAPEFRRTPKARNQEAGIGSLVAIEGLVELGMSPMDAIVAATRNGAIAARGLSDFGTIEAGKLADLIVLDGDPLADISNIERLSTVMTKGRIIDLTSLPQEPVWWGKTN
jgi:imidazolonepropionase-like amidohydrolase